MHRMGPPTPQPMSCHARMRASRTHDSMMRRRLYGGSQRRLARRTYHGAHARLEAQLECDEVLGADDGLAKGLALPSARKVEGFAPAVLVKVGHQVVKVVDHRHVVVLGCGGARASMTAAGRGEGWEGGERAAPVSLCGRRCRHDRRRLAHTCSAPCASAPTCRSDPLAHCGKSRRTRQTRLRRRCRSGASRRCAAPARCRALPWSGCCGARAHTPARPRTPGERRVSVAARATGRRWPAYEPLAKQQEGSSGRAAAAGQQQQDSSSRAAGDS